MLFFVLLIAYASAAVCDQTALMTAIAALPAPGPANCGALVAAADPTPKQQCDCYTTIPKATAEANMKCMYTDTDTVEMYVGWESCSQPVCDQTNLMTVIGALAAPGPVNCAALIAAGARAASGGAAVTTKEQCDCYSNIPKATAEANMKCNYAMGDEQIMYVGWESCQPSTTVKPDKTYSTTTCTNAVSAEFEAKRLLISANPFNLVSYNKQANCAPGFDKTCGCIKYLASKGFNFMPYNCVNPNIAGQWKTLNALKMCEVDCPPATGKNVCGSSAAALAMFAFGLFGLLF